MIGSCGLCIQTEIKRLHLTSNADMSNQGQCAAGELGNRTPPPEVCQISVLVSCIFEPTSERHALSSLLLLQTQVNTLSIWLMTACITQTEAPAEALLVLLLASKLVQTYSSLQ